MLEDAGYCSAVEDFGALMRREEHKSAGHKTVSLVESAAANERWEDPEYRAKQIVARVRQHNKIEGEGSEKSRGKGKNSQRNK